MRIPARFAPIVFGALLSAIMVALVSGFVIAVTQGVHPGFAAQWARSCATTWPVAFPDRDPGRALGSPDRRSRDGLTMESSRDGQEAMRRGRCRLRRPVSPRAPPHVRRVV